MDAEVDGARSDAFAWVDADPSSLRHKKFDNVFALGDAVNITNAKAAASARKQHQWWHKTCWRHKAQ